MTLESFAELLFFTRAAVEADPALANARIDLPLGRVLIQGRPDRPDDPPLAIAGLYRVWDDHAVQAPCPRCGAPRLFLDAAGGGMHRPVAFVHHLCPFCRETNHGHESLWANFRAVRRRRADRARGGVLETTALAVRNLSLDEALALAVSFRQTQFVFRTPLASLVVRPSGGAF